MAIKVTVPVTRTINTSIVSKKTGAAVQTLSDVDVNDVKDGYTLIYNSLTKKWEAVDPATNVSLDAIDGGTY